MPELFDNRFKAYANGRMYKLVLAELLDKAERLDKGIQSTPKAFDGPNPLLQENQDLKQINAALEVQIGDATKKIMKLEKKLKKIVEE